MKMVRERRLALDLTQRELGTLLGVTDTAVKQWEAGRRDPGIDHLLGLASALKCSVEELLASRTPRSARARKRRGPRRPAKKATA